MLECLNIFGNAGGSGNPFKREGERPAGGDGGEDEGAGGGGWRGRRGRGRRGSEDGEEGGRYGRRGGGQQEDGKTTSLRVSYVGQGEPLVMLCVVSTILAHLCLSHV